VRIFRLGWRHASRAERSQIQAEIPRMIDFCLKQTFNADGSFKLMDEDTIGSSFALPVHFLAEAGYFSRRRRFWTSQRFPEARDVAKRISDKIRALGLKDPESQKTLRLLESV